MGEPNIDFTAAQAEVDNMTLDEIHRQLVDLRVKQRVVQLKKRKPLKERTAKVPKKELLKIMVQRAQDAGIYDQVLAEALERAKAKLAAQPAPVA